MKTDNIRGTWRDGGGTGTAGGVTYGYIRVSTAVQHEDRQRIAMKEYGISADRLFIDRQSGKSFDRPAYNKLMARLGSGDTVVVKSLDRLGRDYEEMIRQLDIITREKGAFIVVLDLPVLDDRRKYSDDLTARLVMNLIIQILSYIAQMEREMNHRRTMEGIAAAKARGIRFGRRPMKRPPDYETIRSRWEAEEISTRRAALCLGVAPSTFRRWTKEEE